MNVMDMMSPERVALEYDGNKQKIAAAVQSGLLNPTVAVMAGMFIDRMRAGAIQEQAAKTTVEQDVLGAPQAPTGLGATPQAQQLAQGQERAMAAVPPSQAGLPALPVDESMVPGGQGYAGGGIVAFADGDLVEDTTGGYYPVDPFLAEYVKKKETGGAKDPDTAVSKKGAIGRMQIMPSTAMDPGYGVKNIFDMADDMGIEYKDRSKKSAKDLLTNPTLNETFGKSYLGAMSAKFKNPVLAAASYNAGPGAVTRAGGVPDIKETQDYVSGLVPVSTAPRQRAWWEKLSPISSAEAGELPPEPEYRDEGARAIRNGVVPSAEDVAVPTAPPRTRMLEKARKRIEAREDIGFGPRQFTPEVRPEDIAGSSTASADIERMVAPSAPATVGGPATPKEPDFRSELIQSLKDRTAAAAKQREEDKYMALLAAGLGIMGGKSPYALQNIGLGGLKGAEYFAQARKQQGEEEKDILATRLGLAKLSSEDAYRQAVLADRAAGRDIQLKGLHAKTAALQQKARTEWESSGAKADLIKSFNKKDWMNDADMRGKYELAKNRYINQFVNSELESGITGADELLSRPTP